MPRGLGGGGGLSTCTYRERQIRYFWVRILPNVICFGPNKAETMFMKCLTPNIVELIFLVELQAILTSLGIVSGHFMFMYRFQIIK